MRYCCCSLDYLYILLSIIILRNITMPAVVQLNKIVYNVLPTGELVRTYEAILFMCLFFNVRSRIGKILARFAAIYIHICIMNQ